jgi:hypothetical protein
VGPALLHWTEEWNRYQSPARVGRSDRDLWLLRLHVYTCSACASPWTNNRHGKAQVGEIDRRHMRFPTFVAQRNALFLMLGLVSAELGSNGCAPLGFAAADPLFVPSRLRNPAEHILPATLEPVGVLSPVQALSSERTGQ